MKKINTIILGLGNIGLNYDINNNSNNIFLTHCKSLQKNKSFKVLGGIDNSKVQGNKFKKKYCLNFFKSINSFIKFNKEKIDLAIIATPTNSRLEDIKNISKLNPKVILAEKPLSYKISESKKIFDLCKRKKIRLFINYPRISDISILEIKKKIHKKEFKMPIEGVATYNNGLYNNASHLISILVFWFGDIKKIKIIDYIGKHNKNDYQISFLINFKKTKIIFLANNKKKYSNLDLQLYFRNGKLNYLEEGRKVFWQRVVNDKLFLGFKTLSTKREFIKNRMNIYQKNVYKNLSNFFYHKKYNLVSFDHNIKIDTILNNIVIYAKNKKNY